MGYPDYLLKHPNWEIVEMAKKKNVKNTTQHLNDSVEKADVEVEVVSAVETVDVAVDDEVVANDVDVDSVDSGQGSEKAANNLGRGLTTSHIQIDESPFINNDDAVEVSEKQVEQDPAVSFVKDAFATYTKQMAPGVAVDDAIVRRNQLLLLNAFNITLSNVGVFNENMKFVLDTIRAGRSGVFSDAYVFRGFATLRLSPSKYKRFESLLTLLLVAADVGSVKKVSKHIDLSIVARYLSEEERELVFSYFTVA